MAVVPEDGVATNGDVVLLGELHHRIHDRVVLLARLHLSAVPFHLICEGGDSEPRCKPFLIGLTLEDVVVHPAPEWEFCPDLLYG